MEWMLTVGGVVLVAVVITRLDARVGWYATSAVTGTGPAAGASSTVSQALRSAIDLCRDHQPLAVFAGVAFVLVLFMRKVL